MRIPFPSLRPTSGSYKPPVFPQLSPEYVGVTSYPRLLGSKPSKAELSLAFENIPDSDAALIIAAWLNSLTGFLPLALPTAIVAGVFDADLAIQIRTGRHLDWHFASAPKQTSVVSGISTVQVDLIADLSDIAIQNDPYSASNALLLHMDGEDNGIIFNDSSPAQRTITRVLNPTTSTSKFKFGQSSAYIPGDYARLEIPNISIGADEDYTLELWAYSIGPYGGQGALLGGKGDPFASGPTDPYFFVFILTAFGGIEFKPAFTGAYGNLSAANAITQNSWNHIAAVRKSGTSQIFVQGVLKAQGSGLVQGQGIATSYPVDIGAIGFASFSEPYTGWIDEVRITRHNARYEVGTGVNAGKMVFTGTNALALPATAFPNA